MRHRFCDHDTRQLKASAGTADADQCRISRTRRTSGSDPGVSAARRAAAAARPDAAQHLRAALSGDGRRCLARRPPADRHDPARCRRTRATKREPALFQVGCVGRITQLAETGDGRYILELTGVSRFRVVEEMTVLTAVPAMQGGLLPLHRRFHRAQGRGGGRPRGAARGADGFSQGQQSRRSIGKASRARPTRRWSMRWR